MTLVPISYIYIYENGDICEKEREEFKEIQIKSMAKKNKEDQIRRRREGRITRGRLKPLEKDIRRINMCRS